MHEVEDIDWFDSMVEHKAFLEFLYAFGGAHYRAQFP
jgi:hypothetical protein